MIQCREMYGQGTVATVASPEVDRGIVLLEQRSRNGATIILVKSAEAAQKLSRPVYLAYPFLEETVFTFAFCPRDPSFPAFLPGSGSLQEVDGCPDHDSLSVYSPSAIRLLSRCDLPSPVTLLCISVMVFRCAGHSTCNLRL